MSFFQISYRGFSHIMFIKEKGRKQNLALHGYLDKTNRLMAQNEYIEHWVFKQQIE